LKYIIANFAYGLRALRTGNSQKKKKDPAYSGSAILLLFLAIWSSGPPCGFLKTIASPQQSWKRAVLKIPYCIRRSMPEFEEHHKPYYASFRSDPGRG